MAHLEGSRLNPQKKYRAPVSERDNPAVVEYASALADGRAEVRGSAIATAIEGHDLAAHGFTPEERAAARAALTEKTV